MIDDDDVTFVAFVFSDFRGPVGLVVFLVAVALTAYFAWSNTNECEAKPCPNGSHAELLEGRCVCAQEAK